MGPLKWMWIVGCIGAMGCSDPPGAEPDAAIPLSDAAASDAAVQHDADETPDADIGPDATPVIGGPAVPILYLADPLIEDVDELFLGVANGVDVVAPVKLSQPLGTGMRVLTFGWAPDRSKIHFVVDTHGAADAPELYVVDLSGAKPGDPVRVNGDLPTSGDGTPIGRVSTVAWSPTSTWVAYLSDESLYSEFQLWVADTSGATPGAPLRVNTDLPIDRDVLDYAWSPDGNWLVYRANQDGQGRHLWLVDMSGTSPGTPVKLSQFSAVNRTVAENSAFEIGYRWSSDSARVAYRADREEQNLTELYVVDINAGSPSAPTKINGTLLSGDVEAFWWASDDGALLYEAAENTDGFPDLYVADVSGASPGPGQKVNTGPGFTGGPWWAPDATKVAYLAQESFGGVDEVHVVDVSGASPGTPQKVNSILVSGGDVYGALWSPDSTKILYTADQDINNQVELYVADVSGATPETPQKVNGTLPAVADVTGPPLWTCDSTRAIYRADQDSLGVNELYVVDVSGATPGPSSKVNGPLTLAGEVPFLDEAEVYYAWSPDTDVLVYVADQDTNDVVELYAADLRGAPLPPRKVNMPLAAPANVKQFAWAP